MLETTLIYKYSYPVTINDVTNKDNDNAEDGVWKNARIGMRIRISVVIEIGLPAFAEDLGP